MIKNSLLLVAEKSSWYGSRFSQQAKKYHQQINFARVTFSEVEEEKLPDLKGNTNCMLFYPSNYRNAHKEEWIKIDETYGGPTLGKAIDNYYDLIGNTIKKKYGEQLSFVNSPEGIKKDRDKKKIKEALIKAGVPTSQGYETREPKEILDIIERESLFAKVRWGGHGRCLTYLTNDRWYTNFRWDGKKLSDVPEGEKWLFHEVTGDAGFLEALLKKEIIIEREIKSPIIDGKKFDLRCFAVYNTMPYFLPRSNLPENIITNWSQGGTLEPPEFMDKIPQQAKEKAKKSVLSTAKALNVNFSGIDIIFSEDFETANVLEAQTDTGLPQPQRFDMIEYLVKKIVEDMG